MMQAAKAAVEALKDQPLLLASLLTNIALLVFMFYMEHVNLASREANIKVVAELQSYMASQLSQCVSLEEVLRICPRP